MASRRLLRELDNITNNPTPGCSAGPVSDDLFHWSATIIGPSDSPYADGVFHLDIVFRPEHPFKPPKVNFRTRIFHPKISDNGSIGLGILYDEWSIMTISELLEIIRSMLTNPELGDMLAPEIDSLYRTDRARFESTAREWTHQYAMNN